MLADWQARSKPLHLSYLNPSLNFLHLVCLFFHLSETLAYTKIPDRDTTGNCTQMQKYHLLPCLIKGMLTLRLYIHCWPA